MNICKQFLGLKVHCAMLGLVYMVALGAPQLSNALVSPGGAGAPPVVMTGGGELLVEMYRGGGWQTVGTLSYQKLLTEKKIHIPALSRGNEVQLRISHSGNTGTHIDSVFLGDRPPLTVTGAAERTSLALTKLARRDYDVIDAEGRSLLMTFNSRDTEPVLSLTARIEPEQISKIPFMFPLENILTEINSSSSHFYMYGLNSNDGRLTLDGDLAAEGLGEPFFKVFSRTGSGHPSDYTYGWVRNDEDNLYVAIDFVPDNTMDGEKDYTAVYVNTADGIRTFKASMTEQEWGVPGFTYTPNAFYQHKIYEFQIPFSEIGSEEITDGDHLQLAFSAYGTAAPVFDFGDAPDSYGTTVANNGASHGPDQWGWWYLGHCSDADNDGMPSSLADGDDQLVTAPTVPSTGCPPPFDDEDGVTFLTPLVPGQIANISVDVGMNVQQPGFPCYVTAYIDFNRDGTFLDPIEKVFSGPLNPGMNSLDFPVPPDAVVGTTYARFRCAEPTLGELSPTGNVPNGEVEDYMVAIEPVKNAVIVPPLMPILFK